MKSIIILLFSLACLSGCAGWTDSINAAYSDQTTSQTLNMMSNNLDTFLDSLVPFLGLGEAGHPIVAGIGFLLTTFTAYWIGKKKRGA